MRSFKYGNYSKYSKLYSNLLEQHWYNQRIIIAKWLETLIKISRILFRNCREHKTMITWTRALDRV